MKKISGSWIDFVWPTLGEKTCTFPYRKSLVSSSEPFITRSAVLWLSVGSLDFSGPILVFSNNSMVGDACLREKENKWMKELIYSYLKGKLDCNERVDTEAI